MKSKPKVLFVCVENSCRSQMAEGFGRKYGNNIIETYSAGSHPSGKINPDAVAVMKEADIDISGQSSNGFSDLPVMEFDYVVTMGCGDVCPFYPEKKYVEWDLENPKGKSIYFFRLIRDKIGEKVKSLLRQIIAESAAGVKSGSVEG